MSVETRIDGDTLAIFTPSLLVSDGPANMVFILVRRGRPLCRPTASSPADLKLL